MTDETVLLTYADAAKRLGIKPDSVRRRARNRKWHTQHGNDRRTLVAVPLSVIPTDVSVDITSDVTSDVPSDKPDTKLIVENAELRTELRVLKEAYFQRMNDLAEDRDAWKAQAQKRRWWKF